MGGWRTCPPGGYLLLLLFLLLLAPSARADDPRAFFLHDGDTVVFYGDSLTEQGRYTRDVETYVLTRFPAWHVKFLNSGWIGDKVSGGAGGTIETRLKRDVLPYQPTVVTILLGTNDAGYINFHQPACDTYVQGLTQIVDTLRQRLPDARLTLLTPPFCDENAPGVRHLHGYNAALLKYGEAVKKIGADKSIPVVDLNAPLAEATAAGRRRDPKFTLVPDGIHPGEAGHLILAAALLTAWNAPSAASPQAWPLPDAALPAFAVSPLPGALAGKAQNPQSARILTLVQKRLNIWHALWKGGPDAVAHPDDAPTETETAALTAIDRWLDGLRDKAHDAAQPQTTIETMRRHTP